MKTNTLDIRQMDCMELMAQYPDNHFDLAVVDPPYGIGMGGNAQIKSLKSRPNWAGCKYAKKEWDNAAPTSEYFKELTRVSRNQIIWGGNYFTNYLPPTKSWCYWDKKMSHNKNFSHGELAWASFGGILRQFSRSATGDSDRKIHPTQKPVKLYDWIFANYAEKGMKILDTHLGSGSSAIASHYAGMHLTACELDEDYYKAACERIHRETSQQTFL